MILASPGSIYLIGEIIVVCCGVLVVVVLVTVLLRCYSGVAVVIPRCVQCSVCEVIVTETLQA